MSCKNLLKAVVLSALLLSTHVLHAQDRVISGKVTDPKDGSGVVGVNVTPKGSSGGTQTGADGTYKITVGPAVKILVFSSAGFTTQEIDISGKSTVDVALAVNNTSLGEVVVIGYGTTRKKDLTGSIATVNQKDFQKGVITTPEQLIAGKVAGVSIISNGGQPGSGSRIRIRGGSSLNASNDPLIVIDGVPLDNGGISGGNNPLSFINPNDIESFTILKDASSAAIYGTRAANGVIIITTKKGKGGAVKVSFSSVNSMSNVTKTVDVLSADQIRSIVNTELPNKISQLGTANTDWQKEIYQTALATDNNISISGGIKGLPYRVSLGYLNQEGVLKTDHRQMFSAALALNPVLLDNHLKIDVNLKASQQKYRFANQGAIGSAIYFDPTKPIYSDSKRWNGYWEWLDPNPGATYGTPWNRAGRNPMAMLNDRIDESTPARSIGNIQVDYKLHFFPDLHAVINAGYDAAQGKGTIFVSDSSSLEYATGGENNQYKQSKLNVVLEAYLNYVKDLKSIKSRIDATGGYSYNNYVTKIYNYASYNARGVKVPGSDPNFPFDKPENTLISYFGRLNYYYNEKYLLTATFRADASSRFGPSHQWGYFPSIAFAWKIKDESFLRNSATVSDLKLRLGYGVTGQQDGIANYSYLAFYSLSNPTATYPFGNDYYYMYRPSGYNTDVKWEQTATYNVAIDYGFLNGRINGSVDFYFKKTSDLLNQIPAPAGTNFSAYILANVGNMENRGVEFNINGTIVKNRKLTWDASFNATYNKNKITNLTVVPDDPNYVGFPTTNIAGTQGFAFINAVGTSKSTFYLYHQIYDKSGRPIEGLFEDVNRDGIINENDKYKGKRADPNMFYGFSTNATFGKWNAGFVMRASFNNYVYNNVYSNNGRQNQINNAYVIGNASVNYLETKFVGNTEQQPLSDYYLQNGSFLKMDNLNVGYDFGRVFNNKTTLRAGVTVQNVFVVTKYKGLDPEMASGVDNNFYPRPRIISLGLNLDF